MATILFMMWPETGHLNASYQLAKTLKSRGHAIVYSQLYEFEAAVCAEGFEFVPFFSELVPKDRPVRRDRSLSVFEELGVLCDQFASDHKTTTLDLMREELKAIFGRVKPDLLIMDSYNARFLIPARRVGDPPCILLSPTIVDPYDDKTAALVSNMTTLILCPEEFDLPQRKNRPNYRYVEASCDQQRKVKPGFPWDRVEESKNLVYCSLGTQSHWSEEGTDHASKQRDIRNFLQSVISVMAGREDCQLVMTLSDQIRAEDFHCVPANALLVDYAPQTELLTRASLAITHGGLNTIKDCIFLRVPMLAFPLRGDQIGNAERVAFHGLGLAASIHTASTESIKLMMDQLERDPGFKSRLETMREVFLRIEREQRAVTIIEDRLAEKVNAHAMG
jgi:UDP:flavonoid glycosyltransferase YjiC (YdhE family)